MKTRHLRAALLGSGAAVVLTLAATPAAADQDRAAHKAALKSELEALRARLERLEAKRSAARRAAWRVAPAAAVEAGAKARSWKLPGTNTSMQIGGYAKLDIIYDINAFAGDTVALGGLPVDGSPAGRRQGNFRLHARQSRFRIRTWTPTDWGELSTYIEGDFFGTGGNQLVSNSNAFRLRKAYGRLGPVLAGQDTSTFQISEGVPDTLDFEGPAGQISVRQAQVRFSHHLGSGTMLHLAIENPETGAVVSPASLAVGGALGPSTDPLPDFVVKLAYRYPNGYVALAGLVRRLNVNDGGAAGLSAATIGWAVHFGGFVRFKGGKTSVGGTIVGGQGIGRYLDGAPTSSILNGASGAAARLKAVTTVGGLVWIRYEWTDTLSTTVVYGRSYADVGGANTTGAGGKFGLGAIVQDVWSTHANLIWTAAPGIEIGVEYIYGFDGVINSANGKAHRIQISFKASF